MCVYISLVRKFFDAMIVDFLLQIIVIYGFYYFLIEQFNNLMGLSTNVIISVGRRGSECLCESHLIREHRNKCVVSAIVVDNTRDCCRCIGISRERLNDIGVKAISGKVVL